MVDGTGVVLMMLHGECSANEESSSKALVRDSGCEVYRVGRPDWRLRLTFKVK
jgi:hypothetical protein